jgi:hypothetical protein
MADINSEEALMKYYQMVEMIDSFGARTILSSTLDSAARNSGGSDVPTNANFYKALMRLLLEVDSRGAYSITKLVEKLKELCKDGSLKSAESDELHKKIIRHIIRVYSTKGEKIDLLDDGKPYQNMYYKEEKNSGVDYMDSLLQIFPKETQSQLKKSNTSLSAVLCTAPILLPQNRNVSKIEFWLNHMPSIVVSRMVPFVDVKFTFERFDNENNKTANSTFSLIKFLEGAKMTFEGANKTLHEANFYDAGQSNEDPTMRRFYHRAGMEVFLSPQTMVNPNKEASDSRYVSITDKMRPYASLKSIDISIQPTFGFMTYKNGSLSFTLHDRSRLTEISDLIRPQLFKGATIWITYGWRHPPEPGNAYANFINNNMMMREAFMVVNTELSFDNVGQVNIKLHIATKGAIQGETNSLASNVGKDINNILNELSTITKNIMKARAAMGGGVSGFKEEVRAFQVIDQAARGTALKYDEVVKGMDQIKKLLSNKKLNNPELKQALTDVSKELSKLYGNGQGNKSLLISSKGLFSKIQNTYEQAVKQKFEAMQEGPDPWLLSNVHANKKGVKDALASKIPDWAINPEIANLLQGASFDYQSDKSASTKLKHTTRIVSFGKLFMNFVGESFAGIDGIDEVQVWFYRLNDSCGPASGMNIAEFPIEVNTIYTKYSDYVYKKRVQNISVQEFLSLVINTQFTDPRAIPYGLRMYYKPYNVSAPDPAERTGIPTTLQNGILERQSKYGVFKYPALEIMIETVHANNTNANQPVDLLTLYEYLEAPEAKKFGSMKLASGADGDRRIMRVHVYDKSVDPYPTESSMLRDKQGFIYEIPASPASKKYFSEQQEIVRKGYAKDQSDKRQQDALSKALRGQQGIRMYKSDAQAVSTEGAFEKMAEFVARGVPTITYGSNGTTIKNCNVSSKADPLLSTANMIRPEGDPNSVQPNGAGFGNMPIRVVPATMTMSSLGCPLANPAQLYFFNFGTGTTIDNFYILTHITHQFGPGKFETNWTFGYSDAYARIEGAPIFVDSLKKFLEDEEDDQTNDNINDAFMNEY